MAEGKFDPRKISPKEFEMEKPRKLSKKEL